MRALVTGAGGFCGRHLVRHLTQHGVEVHTIGPRATSGQHHYADPLDAAALTAAIERAQPSQVFHLAGTYSATGPWAYYAANTMYAAAVFEALDSAGANCPVLLVGTSAEYGLVSAAQLPITEDTEPHPYNHYGASKLAQTHMGMLVARQGRPVVVARPFNIIGPGMPPHGAIQSFARQVADIVKGRRPPVIEVGNLDPSRDLVAIEDVVSAYRQLLERREAYGQIVNICSGVETTMREVLATLTAEAGVPIEVRVDPARVRAIDIDRHYGSAARLRAIVGDSPQSPIRPVLTRILQELVRES